MQTLTFINIQKKNIHRGLSPMRSPIRSQNRPVSPLRSSPFSRQQAPMSPIRARKLQRSITPKKQQRIQLTQGQNNYDENYDSMTMTLKSGVGLFQQIANQNKIASEKKKQNVKNVFYQTTQYSQRKKELVHRESQKNTFANLIKNVREIQSFQLSKTHQNSSQFSSKQFEKSNKSQKKPEPAMLMRKNTSTINILESFGSPNNQYLVQNQNQVECEIKQFILRPQNELCQQKNQTKQISSSFQQILALIKKASSQKTGLEQKQLQQSVKGSFEQKNGSISFNMDPFL